MRLLLLVLLGLSGVPCSDCTEPILVSYATACLAARAVHAAIGVASMGDQPDEGLDGRRLEETLSEVRHNGTHLERVVDARWQCAFPQGNCFANHAPLEGLPEKMKNCTTEENKGPLQVKMTIDLHCAGFRQQINCARIDPNNKFDPFYTCSNDPNLIQAKCLIMCDTDGHPKEVCMFDFDSAGLFNMSDATVQSCTMEAACKSPYVEQNQMFCSGSNTTKKFKPHWVREELPWHHRANHGIEAPRFQYPAKQLAGRRRRPPETQASAISTVLWMAAVAMLFAGAALVAQRVGLVERCVLFLQQVLEGSRGLKIGGSYRAPREMRPMEYVAPAGPRAAAAREAGAKPSAHAAGGEEDVQFMAPGT